MEILESYPATTEGLREARKSRRRLAASLVKKGLGSRYGIGIVKRGNSYWVTLSKR
ncbi:hypothetical protein [Streptomyces lydicus]|uniref:hypothetical protein n=1 Tax=Streptomyces lydicus TaxID=47763 RepID=UPI0013E96B1E|nr:hypothetical protein [Streptomyces lydicus]MCZ1012339.1 hypothetical protein [Streptomyces lydicus]